MVAEQKLGPNDNSAKKSNSEDLLNTYEKARLKREQDLERARLENKTKQEQLQKKRKQHILISSLIILLVISTIIILFPTPTVAIASVLLICIFFCIGVSYQRAIAQLLLLAGVGILIVEVFYLIFS